MGRRHDPLLTNQRAATVESHVFIPILIEESAAPREFIQSCLSSSHDSIQLKKNKSSLSLLKVQFSKLCENSAHRDHFPRILLSFVWQFSSVRRRNCRNHLCHWTLPSGNQREVPVTECCQALHPLVLQEFLQQFPHSFVRGKQLGAVK